MPGGVDTTTSDPELLYQKAIIVLAIKGVAW